MLIGLLFLYLQKVTPGQIISTTITPLLSQILSQTQTQPVPEDLYFCQTNNDCVPKPGCHPYECINFQYQGWFEQPQHCSEIADLCAAYKKEDCLCSHHKCLNKNIKNPGCFRKKLKIKP